MKYIATFFAMALMQTAISQDATVVTPGSYSGSAPVNFIRTWDILAPQTNPNSISTIPMDGITQATQYLDGLGRPVQSVIKKGSYPTSGTAVDMVASTIYDSVGREIRSYLPFAASNFGGNTSISDGLFKLNPFQEQQNFYSDNNSGSPIFGQGETYYYSKKEYEASPLNRINKALPAGNAWVNQGRGVDIKNWLNTLTDSVRIWRVTDSAGKFGSYATSSNYSAGQLYKTVTVDEHGKQTIEFKDMQNLLVLKKVQLTATADNGTGSGYTGWLCTYYIYDDLGRIRAVVQPKGVQLLNANSWNMAALNRDILNEQCFLYEYDGRHRITMKKIPGAGTIYMIYDVRDRLVFTQDSNLRSQNKWLATLYDNINRPVVTGLMTYTSSPANLQQTVTTQTTTPGSPNTSIPSDLLLTGPNQTGTKEALGSIRMEVDFETTNGTTFTAQINPGPSGVDGETTVIEGAQVNKNPIPTGADFDLLTNTFYDDYNWCSNYGQVTGTRDASYDSYLLTPSNTTFPYAQSPVASSRTVGLTTGTRVKVLNSSTYLPTVNIYDEKARLIQVQSVNITGATDIVSYQYSFSGKTLINVLKQDKSGANSQTNVVVSKTSYDSLWRVVQIDKKASNTTVNSGSMPGSFTTIVQNEYDALGQLKKKKEGTKPGGGGALANLDFAYNIRGWLLSINKAFITASSNSDQYFGMELGYDKNASLGTFTPLYNGNIAGTLWKSQGDQEKRKYNFSYDAANRITGAAFNQYVSGSGTSATFDKSAGVDFTVSGLSYDANGNILSMVQQGLKGGVSSTIDSLNYNYVSNSNKLLNVIDGANDAQTKLGDFRTSTLHPFSGSKVNTTVDYTYDANANLVSDLNKDIISFTGDDGIQYNHLNLPANITVKKDAGSNKGSVTYTWDATGNKLQKVVTDSGVTTTTLYLSGIEYKNDTLQQIAHDEGRIRYTPVIGTTAARFDYDYFIKDHLGNIRMVLTEQRSQDVYPAATLEGSLSNSSDAVYVENQYYTINSSNIVDKSQATGISPDYQNNNGNPPYNPNPNGSATANSQKLYKLTGTSSGGVTGLGITLKVMAGDTINIFGKSYYFTNNTGGTNYSIPVLDILSGLLGSPGSSAASKGVTASGLNSITNVYNGVSSFLNDPGRGTGTVPKAYINYILLDENFRTISGNFSRVGTAGTIKSHYSDAAMQNIQITKNGYIYVYISNESPVSVFFDNLQVIHSHGGLLQENHYYPFGLSMAGISSEGLNFGKVNKLKFAGKELSNKEFNDGTGLEWYEMGLRRHDPQIGRFLQTDPLADKYPYNSLYAYAENKPTQGIDLEGLELLPFNSAWFRAVVDYKPITGSAFTMQNMRVAVVAANVPSVFKDASGSPLFSASSVNVGPNGKMSDGNSPTIMQGNKLPKVPGWAWTEGDPEPTASTGGWGMGMRSLGENKSVADQASAVAGAPLEAFNWYDTYTNRIPIWNAYAGLQDNQSSFYTARKDVGAAGIGIISSPTITAALTNFVNDGTYPLIDMKNYKQSVQFGHDIMQKGMQIMKDNGINVTEETQKTFDLYNTLLDLLNNPNSSTP